VNGMLTTSPVSETTISFGGLGPASTSITSNGTTNGILWVIRHTNQALFAFDSTNLANEFYNTTQALKQRDKLIPLNRFVTPMITNGKVYVGGSGALEVYGLLPSLSATAGNNQTGTEKQVLPVALTVAATDGYVSNPISGVSVSCVDGGHGGIFSPSATQTTNSSGTITFTYELPSKPQAITITCSSTGYGNAVFSETVTTGSPVKMSITSGNNQSAEPNTQLANPLVVKVQDAFGYGVSGVTVNFTDNGAGGTFSSASAVTASNGTASVQYTTGPNAGKTIVTASSSGLKSLNLNVTVQ
jgi:hypothetical protein